MPRVTRIAGSFAIVVIVYWAYALLAVPWIEPPVDPHVRRAITDDRAATGQKFVDVADRSSLKGSFPRTPGS